MHFVSLNNFWFYFFCKFFFFFFALEKWGIANDEVNPFGLFVKNAFENILLCVDLPDFNLLFHLVHFDEFMPVMDALLTNLCFPKISSQSSAN